MVQIPINPFDNDRLKTRKVQAMLGELGVLPTADNERPTFLRGQRTAAILIDRALAHLAPAPPLRRCSNLQDTANTANAKFTAAYLVDDRGAGLPAGAIAYADFKNGTYFYGGNTLSDLFVENTAWATFDPTAKIVPGVGYVGGTDADGPTIADALAANFLANGYTLVANVASIIANSSFGSDFLQLPDYDPDVSVALGGTGIVTVNGAVASSAHSFPIKLAATLEPTRVACSINGDDAIEDTFSHTGFTNVVMSFNGSTVEDVTFYPPKTDAELQTLSVMA